MFMIHNQFLLDSKQLDYSQFFTKKQAKKNQKKKTEYIRRKHTFNEENERQHAVDPCQLVGFAVVNNKLG